MTVKVVDRSGAMADRLREAGRLAMDAAAAKYEGDVKRRMFRGYYTSGAFRSTAQIVQHVQREPPRWHNGAWESVVGIPEGIPVRTARLGKSRPLSVGQIALAWELGHHNTFTRRYERVEIFKPVALASAKAIADAFSRVWKRYVDKGA